MWNLKKKLNVFLGLYIYLGGDLSIMSTLDPEYDGVRTLRIVLPIPFDEEMIRPIFTSLKLCLKTELLVFKDDVAHFGIAKGNYILGLNNEDFRKLKWQKGKIWTIDDLYQQLKQSTKDGDVLKIKLAKDLTEGKLLKQRLVSKKSGLLSK